VAVGDEVTGEDDGVTAKCAGPGVPPTGAGAGAWVSVLGMPGVGLLVGTSVPPSEALSVGEGVGTAVFPTGALVTTTGMGLAVGASVPSAFDMGLVVTVDVGKAVMGEGTTVDSSKGMGGC